MLSVAAVLYTAQAPGTLLVNESYLQWTPTERTDVPPIRIETNTITGGLVGRLRARERLVRLGWQKAKGKPLLRVKTSGEEKLILQFANEATRETVEKALLPFLSAPGTAQETTHDDAYSQLKRQLLEHDSDLKAVYDGVVASGVLTDEEFWKHRMQLLDPTGASTLAREKNVGLDSALMPEVLQTSHGTEALQLSSDLIQQIFAERPNVKAAYNRHVPADMDEAEFWNRYKKHQDAVKKKRRKMIAGDIRGAQEIDDEYADLFGTLGDETGAALLPEEVDVTLNISFEDREFATGYGQCPRQGAPSGGKGSKHMTEVFDLAEEVNQHGAVVLQGRSTEAIPSVPITPSSPSRGGMIEHLAAEVATEYETLTIQRSTRTEPPSAPPKKRRMVSVTPVELSSTPNLTVAALEALAPSSLKVLEELHYGGDVRDEDATGAARGVSPADGLPIDLLDDMRRQVLCLNEILHRFWSSYPVSSHSTETRVNQLKDAIISHFDNIKRIRYKAGAPRESALIQQLLKPIQSQVDAAIDKHRTELESRQRHTRL